jgi:hypothetical protein
MCEGLSRDLKGRRCVVDGEIVCLNPDGKPQFRDLLFRRAEPRFIAFDILWDEHATTDDDEENRRFRNGEDLRYLPLTDRKLRLHSVVPKRGERLLYCDHIEPDGAGCSGWRANTISKESWRSESPIHTCWSTRSGSRFVITTTRSGSDVRSYSSASAAAILIFRSGMDVLWLALSHCEIWRRRKPQARFRSSQAAKGCECQSNPLLSFPHLQDYV